MEVRVSCPWMVGHRITLHERMVAAIYGRIRTAFAEGTRDVFIRSQIALVCCGITDGNTGIPVGFTDCGVHLVVVGSF